MALVIISWKAYGRQHVGEETRNDGGSFIHVRSLQRPARTCACRAMLGAYKGSKISCRPPYWVAQVAGVFGDDGKLFLQGRKSVVVKRI